MIKNKIAIITSAPLKLAPYIKFYINLFDEYKIDYIIITTSEEEYSYSDKIKYFKSNYRQGLFNTLIRGINGFLFVKKEIRDNNCNKIIVSPTRTAYRLAPYLFFNMRNKYILDIRDLTREKNRFFKYIEKLMIKKSFVTFLSSKGFSKVIKFNNKINYIHNLIDLNTIKVNESLFLFDKIRIVSAGMISYPKVNFELMKKTLDSKIELHYHGLITDEWNYFYHSIDYPKQVFFYGEYKETEKKSIYVNADFINNIYESLELNSKYLTTNRIYDSIRFRVPIIVSKGTYLEELVNQYNIGIAIDVYKDDILKIINQFIKEFKYDEFIINCDKFLNNVKIEQNIAKRIILDFVQKK